MTTSTSTPAPIIRCDADGERRWFYGGGVHTWKATSEETNGAFLLFEDSMERGKATPLHTHPDSDETMIVLDGEIVMHMDGTDYRIGGWRRRRGAAGCAARVSRGVDDGTAAVPAHTGLLARRSTGTPASRLLAAGRTPRQWTSPGSCPPRTATAASSSSDRHRSTRTDEPTPAARTWTGLGILTHNLVKIAAAPSA